MRKGRRKRGTGPAPAARLVDEILARTGAAAAVREHRVVTGWTELVGERIAARAWPDELKKGVLYVRVSNSAWLHELSFLKERLLSRIAAMLGDPPVVTDLRLHLGGRERPSDPGDVIAALARRRPAPRPTPRAPRAIPPAEARRIDEETARVADPELRELVRALRTRLG